MGALTFDLGGIKNFWDFHNTYWTIEACVQTWVVRDELSPSWIDFSFSDAALNFSSKVKEHFKTLYKICFNTCLILYTNIKQKKCALYMRLNIVVPWPVSAESFFNWAFSSVSLSTLFWISANWLSTSNCLCSESITLVNTLATVWIKYLLFR